MPTTLELQDQLNQLWSRMKEMNDVSETENRDFTAEEQTNWDAANRDITTLEQRIARQQALERASATETRRQELHPGRAVDSEQRANLITRESPEYRDAFWASMRVDRDQDISPEHRAVLSRPEVRALATMSGSAGGNLVPTEFERRIERAMLFFGGMRQVATIMATSSGADLELPTSDDTSNTGAIFAENATITEQDTTFGLKVLKAYKYSSKIIRVPWELLQDSAFDIEGYLADILGERIGRITNTHFTVGTGASQPQGLMLGTTQGVAGATGQTTIVTWDDLISLEHSVGISYRNGPGVRYMFHDNTLQAIRKLQDGEGRYLWQPAVTAGAPNLVNGYQYVVNNDMATMAASANSIVFGDLRKYIIRDVSGIQMIRLNELYAASGQVAFLAWSRHDGLLIDAGAAPVKHYSNSAS